MDWNNFGEIVCIILIIATPYAIGFGLWILFKKLKAMEAKKTTIEGGLKITKGKGFYLIKSANKPIVPNDFILLLLSKFVNEYIMYSVNDWYYDEYKKLTWETLNTKKRKICYRIVNDSINEQVFTEEEMQAEYFYEQDGFDELELDFQSFKDLKESEFFGTVYITDKKLVFPEEVCKEKEIHNIFKSHSIAVIDINPDGSFELYIEFFNNTIKEIIDQCICEYNARLPRSDIIEEQNMKNKITESEMLTLKAYYSLPARKLLNHEFELEEDYLAGHVSRFLKGERFSQEFVAFSKEELDINNHLISENLDNEDGKDLLTALLLTKAVCNIMNKYKI